MVQPLLVVAAVIRDGGRVLACRRAPGRDSAGRWEFPGGKVDPGESPEEALHRELREELGVRVGLGPELVGPDDGGWKLSTRYVMRLWLVEVVSGVPEPLVEHDDLRWLPNGQWLDVPWLDADVRIVEALVGALANGTFHTV